MISTSISSDSSPRLAVLDWGRTRYQDALVRQSVLVDKRKADLVPDTLIFTEHEPVYTIGVRPGADQHLVWHSSMLAEQGIDVVKTNRGGDITYHGPGQIVGYPIVSLRERRDLHAYLRDLETVLIDSLLACGLEAGRRQGLTGIWVGRRKIAAIGVAVKSWISYHGFALNVNPNLDHFGGIVPCGITDGTVTSMERELEVLPDAADLKAVLSQSFARRFGYEPPAKGPLGSPQASKGQ